MPVGPATVQNALATVGSFARSATSGVGRRSAPSEVEGHVVAADGSEFDVVVVLTAGAQRTRRALEAAGSAAGAAVGSAVLTANRMYGVLRDPAGASLGRVEGDPTHAPGEDAADHFAPEPDLPEPPAGPHDFHYQVRFSDGTTLEGDGDIAS